MAQSVFSVPEERAAFQSLLTEYFARPYPTSPPPAASVKPPYAPAPTPANPTWQSNPRVPTGLSSVPSRAPLPSEATPPAKSFSDRAQNAVAQHALENEQLTGSALRRAGVPASAATSASSFAASHSAQLAPHLAAATRSSASAALASQAQQGPKAPSGLVSGRSKLSDIKGPLARDRNQPFTESLAVHQKVKLPSAPPPRRNVAAVGVESAGLGTAHVLYDYEGAEVEDLPVAEGEVVTVVEHVSSDWWKCRNASGAEGLVPAAYMQSN